MKVLNNNRKFFLNILAAVLIIYGISMVPPLLAALLSDDDLSAASLGAGAAICVLCGFVMGKKIDFTAASVKPRMNYITTVFIWIIMIFITMVIYYLGGAESTLSGALFQSTASLTTTGASVTDISTYPAAFRLWRSILNWLGGIGLILTGLSCLHHWGFSGHALINVEMPGSEYLSTAGSYRRTCKSILYIYGGLTAAQFILLVIAGMDPLSSVLTSLSNISTAGMQHINNGVITQLSIPVKAIITIFAFLGSVNVSFFILLITRRTSLLKRQSEVYLYTGRLLITAAVIAAVISIEAKFDFLRSFGLSLMQTVSFLSTSGYIVTDCHAWPLMCQMLILLQLFFGACACSTSGGIKTARADLAVKTIVFGLFRHIHPRAVKPVKHDKEALKPDQFASANLFIALFLLTYITGALLLSLDNKNESIADALIYSQAMITNTGSSIAGLGADTAAQFSSFSRIIMSLEMLAGRLEIYPVLMLLTRTFWRPDKNSRV